MKRERDSDSESASGQENDFRTRTSTEGYGMCNPGYSFVRPPPVVQSKPSSKRLRGENSNSATASGPLSSEPEPKKARALSIKAEPQENLFGIGPGIGPSRRSSSKISDIQTPRHNISTLSDVQTPVHNSNLPGVQAQALVQHPRDNSRPPITGNGPSEDENPIVSTIKEKLHKAIVRLTSEEPKQPENPPPWGKHFALSGPCPKMVNPALTIYGLGGIGLPLSERDAGFIANFNPPAPDQDTKMGNTVVDLTTSKITELSPYQLETTNPGWEKAVEGIVAKVAKKLKVPGGVANVGFLPCNMTLYGPGDMLKEHRESKKGKGVFGTLTICLPSKHEGGDLIVTHDDQVKVLSTEPQSAFGYSYIFWLVLMYDLIKIDSDGSENVPDAPISFWQKMDQLESAFQFWKSNFSEQASSCPKFLAYALDNIYDEHKLSRVILQGDDYQRVNGLLQLCKRHGFIIYLSKLRLRVGRERGGQIRENLELQQVVQLDGTRVFDVAPLDASDIVQDDIFRDALNNGDVSGFIGSDIANIDQVYHRFAAMLMPAESSIDFYFQSAKSSAASMGDWICSLTASSIASNGNAVAKIDLKRACQLVIQDVGHWHGTEGTISGNPQKSASAMDNLLGIVIRGGRSLNDQNVCGEALREVRSEIPVSALVEALNHFGFSELLCKLDRTMCRFKHMYQDFRAFIRIYNHYERYKDSTALANMVAWMKPRTQQLFARKQLRFREDGETAAKVGIACGEAYLKETLLPAVEHDVAKAEKLYNKKSAAVFRFLMAISDGQRNGKVGFETARHVFNSILRVFTPRIKIFAILPKHDGDKQEPMPVTGNDFLQLIRQCVSLELKQHVRLVFDKLDSLSMGQSAMTFEGFFLPLMKEFDEMPPGQTPGTINQESHHMAHQLAEKLRKLHAAFFPLAQHMTPRPQHMSHRPQSVISQHRQPSPKDLPEEDMDCTCKDCLKFAAFIEDPAAKSVKFSFGTESRIAHYKTYQLHQITKRGFRHTCTITPAENSGLENYSVTIRKSKAQFAMGTQKGEGSQDGTENSKTSTPNAKAAAPKSKAITPITKASTSIKKKRVNK